MHEPYAVGQLLYRATTTHSNYVMYSRWEIIKVTEKGAWIQRMYPSMYDKTQWVSLTTRFVSRSQEEALTRLIRRTESWVRHAKRRLSMAQERLTTLTTNPETVPVLRTGTTTFYGYDS